MTETPTTAPPAVSKWQEILKKLGQQSTWKGLAAVLAVVGYNLAPDYQEAIAGFFVSVYGLIAIVWDEN